MLPIIKYHQADVSEEPRPSALTGVSDLGGVGCGLILEPELCERSAAGEALPRSGYVVTQPLWKYFRMPQNNTRYAGGAATWPLHTPLCQTLEND